MRALYFFNSPTSLNNCPPESLSALTTPELNHFITIIIITHICKQLTMLCCHLYFVLKQCLSEGDTVYTVLLSLGNPYHDIIHENEAWVLHKTTWTSMILASLELFRPEFDVKMVTMDQNCIVTLKMNVLRIFCQVISSKFKWTLLLYQLKLSTRWKPEHSRFYTCSQGTVGMYGN